MQSTSGFSSVFSRKLVSEAFYVHEIENELRSRDVAYKFMGRKINCNAVKHFIESSWMQELYLHDCGTEGRKNGCPYLDTMDGIWKFGHRHCAMPMQRRINFRFVSLPPVCENETAYSSLYCREHQHKAVAEGRPLSQEKLMEASEDNDKGRRDDIFYSEMLDGPAATTDHTCANKNVAAPWCKKNLGKKNKPNWSRGLFVFVSACGSISYFAPLYRSESMSQVFKIAMEWLYKRLQLLPRSDWNKYFLCYDNMCNFCRLKAHREPLSNVFPEEYSTMFQEINKIIDGLHLSNHRQASYKELFNPDRFNEVHPEVQSRNTMAAEQTFSWIGKFKKQINSMTKTNQLFFIHRLAVRRNACLRSCANVGKKPMAQSGRSYAERLGL